MRVRSVIGKTITDLKLNPTRDKSGIHFNPVIYLDNGDSIAFVVSESYDGSFYGVTPVHTRKAKRPKHPQDV